MQMRSCKCRPHITVSLKKPQWQKFFLTLTKVTSDLHEQLLTVRFSLFKEWNTLTDGTQQFWPDLPSEIHVSCRFGKYQLVESYYRSLKWTETIPWTTKPQRRHDFFRRCRYKQLMYLCNSSNTDRYAIAHEQEIALTFSQACTHSYRSSFNELQNWLRPLYYYFIIILNAFIITV